MMFVGGFSGVRPGVLAALHVERRGFSRFLSTPSAPSGLRSTPSTLTTAMLTSPTTAPPTLSTNTSSASPSSPSRPVTRLRGLSYLRNLHVHSSSSRPPLERSRSQPPVDSPPFPSPDHRSTTSTSHSRGPSLTTTATVIPTPGRANFTPPPPPPLPSSQQPHQTHAHQHQQTPTEYPPPPTMTRNRAETAAPVLSLSDQNANATHMLPSIRFTPHADPRSARPSLTFPSISRTLPDTTSIIRVGRYSERDSAPETNPIQPSAAPVGFKSKVVSRRHCEFSYKNGQWHVKDVKSSSGTFLNHIRLSQPGIESADYPVKDGDVIQLGIDFRGGEEMIFRCVKIRIECNRGWQKGLNNFKYVHQLSSDGCVLDGSLNWDHSKSTHKQLRKLARGPKKDGDAASTHSSECSICLMSIAPCQTLFVAPCSHVWHYKCIRPILHGATYPNFLCPNCRAVADLEADVDEPNDEWEEDLEVAVEQSREAISETPTAKKAKEPRKSSDGRSVRSQKTSRDASIASRRADRSGAAAASSAVDSNGGGAMVGATPSIDIVGGSTVVNGTTNGNTLDNASESDSLHEHDANGTTSAAAGDVVTSMASAMEAFHLNDGNGNASGREVDVSGVLVPEIGGVECPMTPRNDAGPFVLDGRD
ncbi:hypothetical protein K402DRAFT_408978 [Aulographum hederae CBS 113979]|uniref:SMAD/FHA domain-containing protein n=1 Tax=Aulographum hederae CBS 113979 TaxID=1176131 RepID=A0A6G1GJ20_9PEZI|nr:hypothetical protein K402DRAFT_408978 [Aulographum hederae CBS 113979]